MSTRRTMVVSQDASETMQALEDEDWIGLDLETSGLSPWTSKTAVVTLYGKQGHFTGVIHVRGQLASPQYSTFREWLGSPKRKYVTHNGIGFDILFLAVAGVDVFSPTWYDTMVGEAATLKSDRHDLSRTLRDTLMRRLRKEIDKTQQVSTWMALHLTPEQVEYCCGDVQYLPDLRLKQYQEVANDRRAEAIALEMDIAPVVIRMMVNGLPLHLPSVKMYLLKQAVTAQEHEDILHQLLGPVNLASPVALKRAIAAQGYGDIPGTSAEVLQNYALYTEGPLATIAEHLLAYRPAKKRMSMFSDDWQETYAIHHGAQDAEYFAIPHSSPDIRWIHARYKQLGTNTGRFSSSDPNAQQIPKDARTLFGNIPGYKVVSCDYAALEVRVAANVANDKALIAIFEAEGPESDLHRSIAAQLFDKPVEDITATERRIAKAVSFTLLFGGGANLLYSYARMSGSIISLEMSRHIVSKFFTEFKGLNDMRRRALSMASRYPAVPIDLPQGLRRVLAGNDLTATRILNTTVQGTAAAGLKYALLKCQERHLDTWLCATVHDELVAVVPERYAEEYAVDLQRAMVDGMREVLDVVPVKAAYEVGDTWK